MRPECPGVTQRQLYEGDCASIIKQEVVSESFSVNRRRHAIAIYDNTLSLKLKWSGYSPITPECHPGIVRFLPAGSDLEGWPIGTFRKTIVEVKPSVCLSLVKENIDCDKLNLRLHIVNDPITQGITRSLKYMISHEEYKGWPLLIESAISALSISVVKSLSSDASAVLSNLKCGLGSDRRARVLDYIEANIHRQITIAELAKVSALSTYHFARSFKLATGFTPIHYIAARRAEAAKALLKKPEISLAEIAYACGYASQSHMTTAFKAIAGVTPGQYRANVLPSACSNKNETSDGPVRDRCGAERCVGASG